MPTKTKAELIAEIEALKKQLDAEKEKAQYDDVATKMHNMYTSFVHAGFTEDQAWQLVRITFENGTKQTHSKF